MPDQSPLAQAEARIVELEASNAALCDERMSLLSVIEKLRWNDRGRYKSCRLCYRNFFLDRRLPFQHEPDCPLKGMFKEDEEASHG